MCHSHFLKSWESVSQKVYAIECCFWPTLTESKWHRFNMLSSNENRCAVSEAPRICYRMEPASAQGKLQCMLDDSMLLGGRIVAISAIILCFAAALA